MLSNCRLSFFFICNLHHSAICSALLLADKRETNPDIEILTVYETCRISNAFTSARVFVCPLQKNPHKYGSEFSGMSLVVWSASLVLSYVMIKSRINVEISALSSSFYKVWTSLMCYFFSAGYLLKVSCFAKC